MVKWFLKSKTLWVNLIALLSTWMLDTFSFPITPEQQIQILAVVNIFLRFITKSEISWKITKS